MQSAYEIFDVVNEHDEVIGQEKRGEVHRRGLKHRAVHVLVFDSRGRLYLQKRSMTKDTFPGAWDSSASGHLDTGESYDACAVREVREELGLELPRVPQRLFKLHCCAETGQEFVWIYYWEHDGELHPNPAEIERGEWFAPAAISRWMEERPNEFASALRLIWKRFVDGRAI